MLNEKEKKLLESIVDKLNTVPENTRIYISGVLDGLTRAEKIEEQAKTRKAEGEK